MDYEFEYTNLPPEDDEETQCGNCGDGCPNYGDCGDE